MKSISAPSQQPLVLTILNGPNKGAKFQLISATIHIGRDSSNDIVLAQDLRCSRRHAVITVSGDNIQLQDLTNDNPIEVEGVTVKNTALQQGAKFKLGETTMVIQRAQAQAIDRPANKPTRPANPNWSNTNNQGMSPKFLALIGIIAAFFIYMITMDTSSNKPVETAVLTDAQIESNIAASEKQLQAQRQIQSASGVLTQAYRDAQSAFTTCFRDFRVGQYNRAIQACQATLANNPNHPLARQYLDKSRLRLDQLIQDHILEGRKALEKNQFVQCAALFQSAMLLMNSQNDPLYRESKQLYDECVNRTVGRY